MKRLSILFLSVLLILSLCSCKSKEAQAVDDLILAIGDVTLESWDSIESAKNAYDNLTDDDKKDVENYDILETAVTQYEELEYDLQREYVADMIEAIDTLYTKARLKLAYEACVDLLGGNMVGVELNSCSPQLTEEEKKVVQDTIDAIIRVCYAGTYLVQPEYLANVTPDDVWLIGMATVFEYSFSMDQGIIAYNRYKDYCDEMFYFLESGTFNYNGEVWREYLDENDDSIRISYVKDDNQGVDSLIEYGIKSTFKVSFDPELVDWSRVDSTKDDEGFSLRDSTEVTIKE